MAAPTEKVQPRIEQLPIISYQQELCMRGEDPDRFRQEYEACYVPTEHLTATQVCEEQRSADRITHEYINERRMMSNIQQEVFEFEMKQSARVVPLLPGCWDEDKMCDTVRTYSFLDPDLEWLHDNVSHIKNQHPDPLPERSGKTTALMYLQLWILQTMRDDEDSRHVFVCTDTRDARRNVRLFLDLLKHHEPDARIAILSVQQCDIRWTIGPVRRTVSFHAQEHASRIRGTTLDTLLFDEYLETVRYAQVDRNTDNIQEWIHTLGPQIRPGASFFYT